MLYREIIAVCSEIHTKHINTLCGQNVELLNVKLVVHILSTGVYKLKCCLKFSWVGSTSFGMWLIGCRMVGSLKCKHRCLRLHGSTSCGDCNSFNLHVEVCYNQRKMLRTRIEPNALCSQPLELESVWRASSTFVTNNEHSKNSFWNG